MFPPPAPNLDQTLAADYQRALTTQGIRVIALAITDTRARGGARRADIVYHTKTAGSLDALRPEIIKILGPAANPRLALDQVTIRPANAKGIVLATITVGVPDYDRWLKTQISDQEFYSRWTVRRLR